MRKRQSVLDELEELKKKKRKLEGDIDAKTKKFEMLYEKAENQGQMRLLTQANSLKREVKEKVVAKEGLEQKIAETVKTLTEC